MTVDNEKLKPCPFCGGEVQLETVKSRAGTLYGVVCRNTGNRGCTCAMEQVPSRSAEAAIARWNMRKPEEELRKDAERYRWLMSKAVHNGTLGIADGWIDFEFKEEAQQAIDAAMAKEAKQ